MLEQTSFSLAELVWFVFISDLCYVVTSAKWPAYNGLSPGVWWHWVSERSFTTVQLVVTGAESHISHLTGAHWELVSLHHRTSLKMMRCDIVTYLRDFWEILSDISEVSKLSNIWAHYGDLVEGRRSVQFEEDVRVLADDCVVSPRLQLRLLAGCRGRHGEVGSSQYLIILL